RVDTGRLGAAAIGWLATEGHTVAVRSHAADRVIVPIVHVRTSGGPDIAYHLAEQLSVESTTNDAGRWDVFLDAADAAPLLRKTSIMFASGKVLFDVPDRHPGGTRTPKAAPQARHTIDTVATVAAIDGSVTWTGTADATVLPGLTGPLVAITNKAGSLTSDSLVLHDTGT